MCIDISYVLVYRSSRTKFLRNAIVETGFDEKEGQYVY